MATKGNKVTVWRGERQTDAPTDRQRNIDLNKTTTVIGT